MRCVRSTRRNVQREVTGIAAELIEQLALDYGRAGRDGRKPAAIRVNYGIQRGEGGGTAARAVAMLPLITGSWRQRGGGLLLSMSGAFPLQRGQAADAGADAAELAGAGCAADQHE